MRYSAFAQVAEGELLKLPLVTKGTPITEMGDVMRVVMAPNLLLYFVERAMRIAEEMLRETPELAREVIDDA